MERQITKLFIAGMFMFIFSSCYYDVAERLYPTSTCETGNMSYVTDISPILQNKCYVCHSAAVNSGNITLDGYGELMLYVNNGRLLGALKHQGGYSPMPQNAPQLGNCDLAKIEQWITDGAQNN